MIRRREWLAGGLAAAAAQAQQATNSPRNATIEPLTSSSEVFIPPRGRSFLKLSFDFPEPSVEFEGLRFACRVFTYENIYTLDAKHIVIEPQQAGLNIRCTRLLSAGGQESVAGQVLLRLVRNSGATEVTAEAAMPHRVKSLAVIVRGVPRGRISPGGSAFRDHHDDEVLFGYPFSAGDLSYAEPLTSPLLVIEENPSEYFFLSGLDSRVRATRFYLQPGEQSYRVELVVEGEGWIKSSTLRSPLWRLGTAESLNAASRPHFESVEKTYSLPAWTTRTDKPKWLDEISLVVSLHGMHYTGYVFNSFAKMRQTLDWISTHIDGKRVLVFLPAWDGRYYWEYPRYRVSDRLGGESGFRQLIARGHQLGFRFMPMFGANAANRYLPEFRQFANAATEKIDGDRMDLTWVDWDNDRHQEGFLSYMNLGVDSWRQWLFDRIANVIERYQVDAYFLDIVGGWTNNPRADMHAGTRKLVTDLRKRFPSVLAVGEMHYDALLEFIPLFQAFTPHAYPAAMQKYVTNFYHLSHPAPGRGSSGVHEAGFTKWNPGNLSMANPHVIPTLTVVDDTFEQYRDEMLSVIQVAAKWVRPS